jgi:DNA-binding MarR family transcriptional regulator
MNLSDLNWVKDGKYRILVLETLENKNLISSEIANELDINRASMSRILTLMTDKGLISQTKSNSRTVTYSITKKGKEILQEMMK